MATLSPNRLVFEALAGSKLYRDYERAFTQATGLPLRLQPVDAWDLAASRAGQ